MKNKHRLLILTALSSILTGLFYFATYKFNVKFNSLRNILYVRNYREEGGLVLILVMIGVLIVFTLLFIQHVFKDSKQLEIFSQSGIPEYYNKDNHFSLIRLLQYYSIISAFIVLVRDGYRTYTFDGSLMSIYIFKTDILFLMMDMLVILFIIMTITLFIEYLIQSKAITE